MATTEVILKKHLPHLGAEADLVKVKAGYARNFLFPKDLAAPATAASKRQIEELRRKRAEREAAELNEAQEIASKINKATLTFQMSTSGPEHSGKVFGSVTSQNIVDRLAQQGIVVDRRKVQLAHPLKDLTTHEVLIQLGHGVTGKLKVVLEPSRTASAPSEEGNQTTERASRRSSKK